eukprot:2845232-Pleurochrysis_carterae.AAC.1
MRPCARVCFDGRTKDAAVVRVIVKVLLAASYTHAQPRSARMHSHHVVESELWASEVGGRAKLGRAPQLLLLCTTRTPAGVHAGLAVQAEHTILLVKVAKFPHTAASASTGRQPSMSNC